MGGKGRFQCEGANRCAAGSHEFPCGNHIPSSITYLDLRSNAITDAQCGHLAKNLARLNRLVSLNLGENSIYSAGIIEVCYSSSTIADLNLCRNFSEFDNANDERLGIVDHLSKAIKQVSFLKSLDVSGNFVEMLPLRNFRIN